MKVLNVFLAASLFSAVALAQPPAGMPGGPGGPGGPGANGPGGAPAPERTYVTASDIADQIKAADAATAAGTQYRGQALLQAGPFRGGMEYDTKVPATISYAVHDDNDELFIVLDGSGTFTMGGTLVNPAHRGANQSSPTVEGAKQYPLVKGNMIIVPAGTPHAVSGVDGKLVMMTMHMPLPAATAAAAGAAPPPAR